MITELIIGGVVVSAVGGAVYHLYKEGKEYDRRSAIRVKCWNSLERMLNECTDDEVLIARLYMGKVFGLQHPNELYEKIAHKLDVDVYKVEELVRSYDPRHAYENKK
ncbi:hypothetical protein KY312_04820 [Candidatus Woesearchaeota archaeon]|nr:hypothetical protein [Candidatus Woesearchaeota archaeon]